MPTLRRQSSRQTSSCLVTPAVHPQSVHINSLRVSSCDSDHSSTAVQLTDRPHRAVPQVEALQTIFLLNL